MQWQTKSQNTPKKQTKGMVMSKRIQWSYEADYLQACNCDYGCPCEFSAPPTLGYCQGVGVWKINQGSYGDTSLNGLAMAFAAHWPKAIHEGNGTVCFFFDERATETQRKALIDIATGKAGGLPFEILAQTMSKVLEPQFVPFEIQLAGKDSRARVGKDISIAFETIRNPITKEPEAVRLEHGTGFVFKSAECASARECTVKAGELKFSWPDKAAFVAKVQYSN